VPKSIYTPQQIHLQTLLRRLRRDAGLSQAELAERLGVHQTIVSKYELGERRLDLVELEQVCAALGIELLEFVRLYQHRHIV
jgi:transcriptional regulator with XRE-family HTH domain